jgi:proline dehydrogenase
LASLSFNNTENAFSYKTDAALKKARFLFSCMRYSGLVKLTTALLPWAMKVGLPVKGLIRSTIFSQFVGGESLASTAALVQLLAQHQVQVILDYGVEASRDKENALEKACEAFIEVINYAATQPNIPFISIKVTAIARFGLLEKLDESVARFEGSLMKRYVQATELLAAQEFQEWHRVQERIQKICKAAAGQKVGVLVDAEETWVQNPIDVLTILMMEQYNTTDAVVYNTVQLYRQDRVQFLADLYDTAVQRNFLLGVKLVRGAYMEKERKRAELKKYTSPIHLNKEACDVDYNAALAYCIERLNKVAVVVASHNEYSNRWATTLMLKNNLPMNHMRIHFSQLYGMSDNITFNLAQAGCNVSKYVPFGPIEEVVPYLIRRLEENSSVAEQTGRELNFIKKEIARRGL